MVWRIASLAVTVACLLPAPASGADEIDMQALLNPDGTGHLFVNNTDGPWQWENCSPDLAECKPFGGGREISTAGAEPHTIFRVKSEGLIGLSPEWRGRVKSLVPPSVSGVLRANQFVSPVPGRWARGWEDEFSELQLTACAAARGRDCTTLTHSHYLRRGCSKSSSFVLDAKFTGSYLRVANRRIGAGPHFVLAYAVGSPYGGVVWKRNPVTSIDTIGRIAPPVSGYPGECGPPVPNEGSISRQGVAFIRCGEDCDVSLTASRAGRVVRIERQLPPSRDGLLAGPPVSLQIHPSRLVRLGSGPVGLKLRIDGKLVAQRIVRFAVGGGDA
jgi:hypothetical protein